MMTTDPSNLLLPKKVVKNNKTFGHAGEMKTNSIFFFVLAVILDLNGAILYYCAGSKIDCVFLFYFQF